MKKKCIAENMYTIELEDGEELLACAGVLNSMRQGIRQGKREDIWRQVEMDALATAIVELAKDFPDQFVREVVTEPMLIELINARRTGGRAVQMITVPDVT